MKEVFKTLDLKNDGVIDIDELTEYLTDMLGHKPKQGEVLNMIWELDIYQTSTIGWDEFKTMFERVRSDKAAKEPRLLYNLVEFMTFDKDGSGLIDEEEIRQIFFFHHGLRGAQLDEQMKSFYAHRNESLAEVSYSEYLKILAMMSSSSLGPDSKPTARQAITKRKILSPSEHLVKHGFQQPQSALGPAEEAPAPEHGAEHDSGSELGLGGTMLSAQPAGGADATEGKDGKDGEDKSRSTFMKGSLRLAMRLNRQATGSRTSRGSPGARSPGVPRYLQELRRVESPPLVDSTGHFRIRPLTRGDRLRLSTSHSSRSICSARGPSTARPALRTPEAPRFAYFVDPDFQSFGQHHQGSMIQTITPEDEKRYHESKLRVEQKVNKDRPLTVPNPQLFSYPHPKRHVRSQFAPSPAPDFLHQEPKDGYWRDDEYKAKRHVALYANYNSGRSKPIPLAFQFNACKSPKRQLRPNAYYKRQDIL